MRKSTVTVLVLLCACVSDQGLPMRGVDDYVSALATLELDPNRFASYQEYYRSTETQMASWLRQFDDPEELKAIFYACQAEWLAGLDVPGDDWDRIDPYGESKNLVLYRLAEIRTPEAAEVLVDLYCDPNAQWDAAPGEMACDAVLQCGRRALQFLREKQDPEGDIAHLIQLIEAGVTTAFGPSAAPPD